MAQSEDKKVFNDPIHGSMVLHPLLIRIIDTPQFQRLRNIKQLGGAYWVFPGASHNRFEHSIGVCFLAGKLVQALKDRQKDLNITLRDVLCVQVAGLCHDLGHGPFSHMFEKRFIPHVGKNSPSNKWMHEEQSVKMFDHLVKENHLDDKELQKYGLVLPQDLDFIRELINGPQNKEEGSGQEVQGKKWLYSGRNEDMSFLYEIVANKKNGIDVDKWDYFARDCHHLGIQNTFDYRRFIEFARVCEVEDGKKQICIRDKEVNNVCDMFLTRRSLHMKAYQHRVCNIIEIMIAEAFLEADQHMEIKFSTAIDSEAIDSIEAYTKLTDNVFYQILTSTKPELKNAQEILKKISKRNLYRFVGESQLREDGKDIKKLCDELKEKLVEIVPKFQEEGVALKPEDFVVDHVSIDHRIRDENPAIKKKINPLINVCIYSKLDPNKGTKITEAKASELLPDSLAHQMIRVYLKMTDEETQDEATQDEATQKEASQKKKILNAAKEAFQKWCKEGGFHQWVGYQGS